MGESSKDYFDPVRECSVGDCKQLFPTKRELINHVQEKHSTTCLVCSLNLGDSSQLMSHLSAHGLYMPAQCATCLAGFDDISSLQCHLMVHIMRENNTVKQLLNTEKKGNGMNTKFPCNRCSKVFISYDSMMTHAFVDHKRCSRNTDFVCGYCNQSYTTLSALKEHQSEKHTSEMHPTEKNVKCHICLSFFSTQKKMIEHCRQGHLGPTGDGNLESRKYFCSKCSVNTKTANQLANHVRVVHMGREPKKKYFYPKKKRQLLCTICGKLFLHAFSLQKHVLMNHSSEQPAFKCHKCGLMKWTRQDLKKHLDNHTDKEMRKHTCVHCGQAYSSNKSLQVHLTIHSGVKPYKCKHCEKTFRCDSSRNRHELIHTDVFPYSCDICAKQFRTISNLKQHRRQRFVHKNYNLKSEKKQPRQPHNEQSLWQQQFTQQKEAALLQEQLTNKS